MQRLYAYLLILKYLDWIKALIDANSSTTYAYDPLYRLTEAIGPWGSIQYNYDPVGNRSVETTGEGVTNYSYSNNKLLSSTGVKPFTFSYDNNGNTISENQRQYVYNQNQRLIKAVENGNTLGEYKYNGNGQRVKKTANGKTTYYIYDQSGNLIEEADESGQVKADYIYLGSIPIARVDEWWEGIPVPKAPDGVIITPGDKQLTVTWNANQEPVDGYKIYWGLQSRNYTNSVDVGKTTSYTITGLINGTTYYVSVTAYADLKETYYYHTDHLGTSIMMTDKQGNRVWEGEFLPFGEPLAITGTIKNNLRFPGQYFDAETGLHYNWHRDYKPEIGRYISEDPILKPGDPNIPFMVPALLKKPAMLHAYTYVGNDPVNHKDLYGLFTDPGNLKWRNLPKKSNNCRKCDGTWVGEAAYSTFIALGCTCYWWCTNWGNSIHMPDPHITYGTVNGDDCECPDPDGETQYLPLRNGP